MIYIFFSFIIYFVLYRSKIAKRFVALYFETSPRSINIKLDISRVLRQELHIEMRAGELEENTSSTQCNL